jgi:hypothetical protein
MKNGLLIKIAQRAASNCAIYLRKCRNFDKECVKFEQNAQRATSNGAIYLRKCRDFDKDCAKGHK